MIDREEVLEKLADAECILFYFKNQNPHEEAPAEIHAAMRAVLENFYKWKKAKEND